MNILVKEINVDLDIGSKETNLFATPEVAVVVVSRALIDDVSTVIGVVQDPKIGEAVFKMGIIPIVVGSSVKMEVGVATTSEEVQGIVELVLVIIANLVVL